MATLSIVNPIAKAQSATLATQTSPAPPRINGFSGKTIGLYWNGKNRGNYALGRTKENPLRLFPDLKFREYIGAMGGVQRICSDQQLDQMADECDAVIGTNADCGSCTSTLIRDMSQIEKRGTPAAAWTARKFIEDARWSAKLWGRPDIGLVEVPECFSNNEPDAIRSMVDAAMQRLLNTLTVQPLAPGRAFDHVTVSPEEAEFTYRESDAEACWDAMNRNFVQRNWSDGLPLVPPTAAKVDAMVAASGLARDHVLGLLEPGFGIATMEKIAANAVMAGARPEMMPVITAAVECLLDPRSGMRVVAMSTGPQAPVIMVSGPIAKEIGMNSGVCAVGPASASQVNVAIGRAIRLIMMNVGHAYPGVSDMDTHGSTMKFGYCVAESEESTPWEPLRVQKGFERDCSTVTVNSPFAGQPVWDFENHDPRRLIEVFASAMVTAAAPLAAYWLTNSGGPADGPSVWRGDSDNLIFFAPDHAKAFGRAGWTPQDIREALFEAARMPFRKAMLRRSPELFKLCHPHLQWLWDQPETPISVFMNPNVFDFLVLGGDTGWSTYHEGGSYSITREIASPS